MTASSDDKVDTYIDNPPSTEACATIEPVIVSQLIYLDSLLVVRQRYPRCHIAERAANQGRSPPQVARVKPHTSFYFTVAIYGGEIEPHTQGSAKRLESERARDGR